LPSRQLLPCCRRSPEFVVPATKGARSRGRTRACPEAACGAEPQASTERVRTRRSEPLSGHGAGLLSRKGQRTQGNGAGGLVTREAKNAARRAPSCERSSHHSRQLDVQKGRQSLLVGVSRKASAESPKGRDPQGARCAARDASGARHSGFRATPGNAPRLFVFAGGVDSYCAGSTLTVATDQNTGSGNSAGAGRQLAIPENPENAGLSRPAAAANVFDSAVELAIAG